VPLTFTRMDVDASFVCPQPAVLGSGSGGREKYMSGCQAPTTLFIYTIMTCYRDVLTC
jgi:hypothetical protein